MADQEVGQHEEGTEAVENKSSLSYMMEHPDETTAPVNSPQDQETQEEKEAREAAETEAAAAVAGGSEEETPEQKVAREEAEAEADKTKDWTVEDFRKGYKEAETRMHEATGETAKEKTAREAAEVRAAAAETKLAEQEAERERLAAEAAKPKAMSEDEQDAVFEKAAEELRDLDTTDPDYLKNYGRIWRKAINAAGQDRTPPDPETASEAIASKAWEKFQAKQAVESAKTAETREKENQERLDREANDFAKQSGLDMTPGSADYRLFWDIAHNDLGEQEFMKGDTPPPPKDQYKWVTEEAKRLKGQVVEQTDEERRLALVAQKNNAVMGKGVSFTPSKETPKKRTLSEIMDSTSP
jgi:hypothetical protein